MATVFEKMFKSEH